MLKIVSSNRFKKDLKQAIIMLIVLSAVAGIVFYGVS